jgi:hypothetical protein
MIYTSSTGGSKDSIVSLGIFEFMISIPLNENQPYPQFRVLNSYFSQTIYWQVNEYWNKSAPDYDFNLYQLAPYNLNGWKRCKDNMDNSERNEVWLADLENDHLYQVQFIIIKGTNADTYIIIAKKY